MKTILLPVEPHDLMASTMETANHLATRFKAVVDGVALRPSLVDFVVPDPMGALVVQPPSLDEEQMLARARDLFETFSANKSAVGGPESACTFRWRGWPTVDDATLGSTGRLFDCTVLGRPGTGRNDPRMTSLETALFESGRPIIVAPPEAPRSIGTSALIHWNASTETSRCIAFALPLLKLAERVHIVTVEGAVVPGPTAAQLIDFLAMHGIKATESSVRPTKGPGEAILDAAVKHDCDLLVKGAYTQSRLKQMIFGGATSHILSATHLPVIMAH